MRFFAKEYGDTCVLEVAQGMSTAETKNVKDQDSSEIKSLYKEILGVDSLGDCEITELLKVLQPDSLLERFAYRKAAGMGHNKEFIKIKGSRGQIENKEADSSKVQNPNEQVGFKCLHYSVTESSGTVELTIVKKQPNSELTFGYRTIADTATAPKDYTHCDEVITIKKREQEKKIYIPVVDDDEWEPDLDFFVELYDPTKMEGEGDRLPGDDTRCKVTILDEDFPGSLGFETTEIVVNKKTEQIEVTIVRSEGSDGTISCTIRTEPLSTTASANNAVEFEDYLPVYEQITFLHQENEKTIPIKLVTEKVSPPIDDKKEEDGGSEDEECDVIFKIKLEKPEPNGVKISKKNVCLVTITKNEDAANAEDDKQKLIEYYLSQQEPTWKQQFKNAVMLGPSIDEDNLILEDVSLSEAMSHFCAIGWKTLFATIPPPNYWGGKACFVIALAYIGLVTALVAEFATILGCVLGIKESVTAITFVALGTSLPDTFASMTAAQTSEHADAAIGNITGSNSVNVFLGLGLPWAIAATYWQSTFGTNYTVPAGALAFSVFVFLVVAISCFLILVIRRKVIGGELGGPTVSKWLSAVVCIGLWFIYIIMSTL